MWAQMAALDWHLRHFYQTLDWLNIWTSVGLWVCLSSALIPVWARYNLWSLHSCHQDVSLCLVLHDMELQCLGFFVHPCISEDCWRLALKAWRIPPSSSLYFWRPFKVLCGHGQSLSPRISELTHSLRTIFFRSAKKGTFSSSRDGGC